MVNSDMFDVDGVKTLRISNEELREAIISESDIKIFHQEPYCLIKDLNPEVDFIHPEDLMIEDDRTWGHYEFDFSANGTNKAPRYFYRNNIIDQTEIKNIEENDLTYKYKIKSLFDSIILNCLKNNANFVELFNVADEIIDPNNKYSDLVSFYIYRDINGNYYEYYEGNLINLYSKYYSHTSVLTDVWDITNYITESFYTNKGISNEQIQKILTEYLNKTNKNESLVATLAQSIYKEIYDDTGKINNNLIRQYIKQDLYHYYEINDELILDYSANKLYIKKNRLQHYLNIADGKSVRSVILNSENYVKEEDGSNYFKVEIDNDFGFTKEDDLKDKIMVEVIDKNSTIVTTVNEKTKSLILEDVKEFYPDKTKVYVQTPSKQTELKEASSYDYIQENEKNVTQLKLIDEYNFSEKGLVKIYRKDKENQIQSEDIDPKENLDLIETIENKLLELLLLNAEDIMYFSAFIEEKEQKESSSIILNSFEVNFDIYDDDNDGKIDKIILDEQTKKNINNTKNILTLITYFIYPEEKLNYTLVKNEQGEELYLALDKDIVLERNDKIYYKQEEYSTLAYYGNTGKSYYSYTCGKDDQENVVLTFTTDLDINTQVSIFYNPLGNFSSIQNVTCSLSEDNKKIIIKFFNLSIDAVEEWEVGLIFSEYFNSNLSLSIFYQTRRIKDYLLSNRKVNWNVNNPSSINYVLNRPVFQRNDKKIAMLREGSKIYTNGEEDYYHFFSRLILEVAGEPDLGLKDRVAALELWREREIDPYIIKLKTYQYTASAEKADFDSNSLVIGSNQVELNDWGNNSIDKETSEFWKENYNMVGSMKALNDLADYCAALKKRLDSINGSLIHIGANSPDDEEKYACKVCLNTRKDNGNGIFYYRTVSKSEVPPIGAENYSSLLSASELWIPASAVWSNKVDTGSSGSGDNSNNDDENDLIRYQLLSELEVGNEVNIGGMTFTVVQKGLPTRDDAIVQDYGLAGLSNSNGRIYEKYFSEVQNGVFLIWTPSVESEGAIWVDENNQPLYKDITTERVSDHSVYNYTIRDNLKKLQTKLESEYNPSWFIKQVNYYRPTNATLYDGKIYLPTRNQLEDQRASVGDTAVYPAALDYFKTLSKERRKFSIGEYFTAELGKVDTEGIITGVSSIPEMSNTPMTANLRPLIVLNGNLAKVTQIDGSYYKLLKKSES